MVLGDGGDEGDLHEHAVSPPESLFLHEIIGYLIVIVGAALDLPSLTFRKHPSQTSLHVRIQDIFCKAHVCSILSFIVDWFKGCHL